MLKQRIITALILVALLGAALYWVPAPAVWIIFAAVVALAGWEWGALLRQTPTVRIVYALAIFLACAAIEQLGAPAKATVLGLAGIFWLAVVPLWLNRQWSLQGRAGLGQGVGGLVLVATWAGFDLLYARSPWLLVACMALVWVADIAAYFFGRVFGRRKLAPRISPGKTWAGVVGAQIAVAVYGLLVLRMSPLATQWQPSLVAILGLCLLLTTLSVIGDLFESLLKRQAQVKDSSNLLPGHGGVLDRVDSLTSTIPVAALLLSVLA